MGSLELKLAGFLNNKDKGVLQVNYSRSISPAGDICAVWRAAMGRRVSGSNLVLGTKKKEI